MLAQGALYPESCFLPSVVFMWPSFFLTCLTSLTMRSVCGLSFAAEDAVLCAHPIDFPTLGLRGLSQVRFFCRVRLLWLLTVPCGQTFPFLTGKHLHGGSLRYSGDTLGFSQKRSQAFHGGSSLCHPIQLCEALVYSHPPEIKHALPLAVGMQDHLTVVLGCVNHLFMCAQR